MFFSLRDALIVLVLGLLAYMLYTELTRSRKDDGGERSGDGSTSLAPEERQALLQARDEMVTLRRNFDEFVSGALNYGS